MESNSNSTCHMQAILLHILAETELKTVASNQSYEGKGVLFMNFAILTFAESLCQNPLFEILQSKIFDFFKISYFENLAFFYSSIDDR